MFDSCGFTLASGGQLCTGGRPCAVVDLGPEVPDGYTGRCVSAEFCREASLDTRLPAFDCVFADSSLHQSEAVATTPDSCSPGGGVRFCAGGCMNECERTVAFGVMHRATCAGVNDLRSFGVCPFASTPVYRGENRLGYELQIQCVEYFGEACGVMKGGAPVGARRLAEFGWVVSQRACTEYRARFPGSVECFTVLPNGSWEAAE